MGSCLCIKNEIMCLNDEYVCDRICKDVFYKCEGCDEIICEVVCYDCYIN